MDGALPDTTSPPSTQSNRVPELFVKHQSGLTDAEKRKNWSLSVENSTETLILGYSMVGRINDVKPYKNVQIHVFPGGRIQHLTQVLQNYRRKDCTKLKNVIIMFELNDVLKRKGTVLNYTGIYNTHAIDPMYALKVCRVNDIYRKAVKDNTPGVSYINKLGLRCEPSGPNDVIHWCSDHATEGALYTLKKCLN